MSEKFRVGILGATGTVGQRFIELLEGHPQFEVTALAASDRSRGKAYAEACAWRLPCELPARVAALEVSAPVPPLDCDIIFSSLPGEMARDTEDAFARAGYAVISNSSAFRMDEDVPLLIPEINPEHLALVETQRRKRGYERGFIITNPNCSTIMIALALAPLQARFGIESCVATTLQALSGAGYPGVASLDVVDNVLPYIGGEEEKIESETLKILGRMADARVEPAALRVSAQCHRVNVSDGHMAALRVKLARPVELEELKDALASFRALPQKLRLHSAPARPVVVRDEPDRPQPRLDRDAGRGMSVTVGRIRRDAVLDYRFVALSHNTVRGAAGAAILNAELLAARGYLKH
jgi:aspartate-semialdehyde dehydrogenase